MFVAVGIEDHRALAEAGFEAIGVELGLLLALPGVLGGALGLHQPERLAVLAPEHVVDEAHPLGIGHALDAELGVVRPVERPAGLAQQEVDVAVAGLGLVVVVTVGPRLGGFSGGGHFGAQLL